MQENGLIGTSTEQGETTQLDPTQYLDNAPPTAGHGRETALIILNSPLDDFDYFDRLYNNSAYVVCADGGANRLHDLLIKTFPHDSDETALRRALPHAIHGDLDSIRSDVQDAYTKLAVEVTKDPDQYSTDFGKAIKRILKARPSISEILVLGSLGGRVDQGIGLLHEFYREQHFRHPELRFWLFSEGSISIILKEGTTVLKTGLRKGIIGRNIGILPLYGAAVIGTSGLEWDVRDWKTEMGGALSTSNHIMSDIIEIRTDRDVLFTVERAGMP